MRADGELAAASLAPAVLRVLAEGGCHGYAIARRVRERATAGAEWPDGMLYPVLHRLERLGHLEVWWEVVGSGRRRKFYRLARSRADRGSYAQPP